MYTNEKNQTNTFLTCFNNVNEVAIVTVSEEIKLRHAAKLSKTVNI